MKNVSTISIKELRRINEYITKKYGESILYGGRICKYIEGKVYETPHKYVVKRIREAIHPKRVKFGFITDMERGRYIGFYFIRIKEIT